MTEVRAVRDILPGEEMTVAYFSLSKLPPRAERREKLTRYQFVCQCEVCSLEGKAFEDNELMRKKIRDNFLRIEVFTHDLARPIQEISLSEEFSLKMKEMVDMALFNERAGRLLREESGEFLCEAYRHLLTLHHNCQMLNIRPAPEGLEEEKVYWQKLKNVAEKLGTCFLTHCLRSEEMFKAAKKN